MQFLIGERLIDLIDSVGPEGVRYGFTAIQLFQAFLQVGSIAYFDILLKGGIGEDIYAAGVFHRALVICYLQGRILSFCRG